MLPAQAQNKKIEPKAKVGIQFEVDGSPILSAKSAVILDGETGRILWGKNPEETHFPASTTKIMTTLLLLERAKMEDVVTAPANIKETKESSMHLQPGETVTVRNLLYGLMLRSANDGCVSAGVHVAGSVQNFVKLMNDRAAEIGCRHTHFVTPNGLHDPDHFTTAHDLGLIAFEAMKRTDFRELVKTQKFEITRSMNQADRLMVNRNKILAKDPTCEGIKTGYTNDAGHTFVGATTRNGFRVITVLLGGTSDWVLENQALVQFAYQEFERKEVVKKGVNPISLKVENGAKDFVACAPAESVKLVISKRNPVRITPEIGTAMAPIKVGDKIGSVWVEDDFGYKRKVDLVATENVEMKRFPVLGSATVAGVAILGLTILGAKLRSARRPF